MEAALRGLACPFGALARRLGGGGQRRGEGGAGAAAAGGSDDDPEAGAPPGMMTENEGVVGLRKGGSEGAVQGAAAAAAADRGGGVDAASGDGGVGGTNEVNVVRWAPVGGTLALGSDDGAVRLCDTAADYKLTVLGEGDGPCESVSWSCDGRMLAAGFDSTKLAPGSILLFDAASEDQAQRFEKRLGPLLQIENAGCLSVAFSPRDLHKNMLASAWYDNFVRLWDSVTAGTGQQQPRTLEGHKSAVLSVAFSPDGIALASGSWDKTVRLWDTATGETSYVLKGHTDTVKNVAFSPDGSAVASSSSDTTVRLWDARTGAPQLVLNAGSTVWPVAFSPDSTMLAAGCRGGRVRLWDIPSGTPQIIEKCSHTIWSVAFAPVAAESGRMRLAFGSGAGVLRIYSSSDSPSAKSASNDTATESDLLGHPQFADALVEAICRTEPNAKLGEEPAPLQTLAVGIYAEWGAGKSSLLESIKARIEEKSGARKEQTNARNGQGENTGSSEGSAGVGERVHRPVVYEIIDFNAWTYSGCDNLWAGLIEELYEQLELNHPRFAWEAYCSRLTSTAALWLYLVEAVLIAVGVFLAAFLNQSEDAARIVAATVPVGASLVVNFLASGVFKVLPSQTERFKRDAPETKKKLGFMHEVKMRLVSVSGALTTGELTWRHADVSPILFLFVVLPCELLQRCVWPTIRLVLWTPPRALLQRCVWPIVRLVLSALPRALCLTAVRKWRAAAPNSGARPANVFLKGGRSQRRILRKDAPSSATSLDGKKDVNRSVHTVYCLFVDDLDRCQHDKIVEVLQAINLLLESPNMPFIVWLAVDVRVVVAALDTCDTSSLMKAGVSGSEFLDKIVHLPFVIPQMSRQDGERVLRRIMVADNTQSLTLEHEVEVPWLVGGRSGEGASGSKDGGKTSVVSDGAQLSAPEPMDGAAVLAACKHMKMNARAIKRLYNVYVAARALKGGAGPTDHMLILWLICCAQWPYRTAWLLKLLEKGDAKG